MGLSDSAVAGNPIKLQKAWKALKFSCMWLVLYDVGALCGSLEQLCLKKNLVVHFTLT